MKTPNQLWKIVMDIYRELYKKASPKSDFDELIKSGEAKKEWFFHNYHIPQRVEDEIIEKHIKKNRLFGLEANIVRTEVYLGCSPCSCEGRNPEHRGLNGQKNQK
jgi:hypothetical protein